MRLPDPHRRSSSRRSSARCSALLHARAAGPELAKAVGYVTTAVDARLRRRTCSGTSDRRRAASSSSRTSAWIRRARRPLHRRRRRHQPVHGALTALLFPIGLLASAKYIDAPGEGVHVLVPAARGRDHGHLPLPRPHLVLRVLGADARPDVLPHPGWGSEQPRLRGDEVLPLHDGGLGVPARVDPGARRSCTRADTGVLTFDYRVLADVERARRAPTEVLLFLGFMVAFAIKAPLFPFHTWLPDVHTEAPDRGLGGAGRRDPEDGRLRLPALLVRAVPAGVGRPRADAARARGDRDHLRRDRRRDADRPETRSSRTRRSRTWASSCSASSRSRSSASTARSFTMLSHPLTTGALFLVVGMLYERRHTREIVGLRRHLEVRAGARRRSSSSRRSPASACPASPASSASSSSLLGAFVVRPAGTRSSRRSA